MGNHECTRIMPAGVESKIDLGVIGFLQSHSETLNIELPHDLDLEILKSSDADRNGKVTACEYVNQQELINPGLDARVWKMQFERFSENVNKLCDLELPKALPVALECKDDTYFKCKSETIYSLTEDTFDSLYRFSENARTKIIDKLLDHPSKTIRLKAIASKRDFGFGKLNVRRSALYKGNLSMAREDARAYLIEKALADKEEIVREQAAWQIKFAPESKRAFLIARALTDETWNVQAAAFEQIYSAPKNERTYLIEQAFDNGCRFVRKDAVSKVRMMPEGDRAGLIRKALRDQNSLVRYTAASHIRWAAEASRFGLIKAAIEDSRWQCDPYDTLFDTLFNIQYGPGYTAVDTFRMNALSQIEYVPDRLGKSFLLLSALASSDYFLRNEAIRLMNESD